MKKVVIIILAMMVSVSSYSESHENKAVLTILSPEDNRACTLFQLNGVGTADPVNPGKPWFGVPKDHPGHDTIVSMLLVSFTSGKAINVTTTGQNSAVCGHSEVKGIYFAY